MKRMYRREKEKRKTEGNTDPQRVRLERLKDICVSESRSGVVGTDVRNGRNIIGSDVNLPNYNAKSRRGNHERKPRLINSGKGARQMASICTTKFLSRGKKSASGTKLLVCIQSNARATSFLLIGKKRGIRRSYPRYSKSAIAR